jgi:hypothetical protein
MALSALKTRIPSAEPARPPAKSTRPIVMSTLRRCRCASSAEKEEATIWLAAVATATGGGMPATKRSGVMRNPPPTPNMPESTPTSPPRPRIRKAFTETSAMGR